MVFFCSFCWPCPRASQWIFCHWLLYRVVHHSIDLQYFAPNRRFEGISKLILYNIFMFKNSIINYFDFSGKSVHNAALGFCWLRAFLSWHYWYHHSVPNHPGNPHADLQHLHRHTSYSWVSNNFFAVFKLYII